LIIALIVTAVLVVVAVGAYVGISLKKGDTDYSVGKCVSEGKTSVVDCSEAGAFRIVSSVDSVNECPDAKQPWLVVVEPGGKTTYRCLAPAASS
jgi:hypothetical protein